MALVLAAGAPGVGALTGVLMGAAIIVGLILGARLVSRWLTDGLPRLLTFGAHEHDDYGGDAVEIDDGPVSEGDATRFVRLAQDVEALRERLREFEAALNKERDSRQGADDIQTAALRGLLELVRELRAEQAQNSTKISTKISAKTKKTKAVAQKGCKTTKRTNSRVAAH